jgi:cytochrome d ubiquinol oxidase subunit II
MDLNTLWFILLGVLLAGYAILDGFDLGVGILEPIAKTDEERRILLNSIGPIWDGNEVWLVTFGGAMFAAFPESYATAFSGFYTAFMLILFALILRAVSIDFRSKIGSHAWRRFWDYGFFVSSLLAAQLFGTAVGAAMNGIPLNDRGVFSGRFLDQLGVYPLAVGIMTVAMFTMHGAIYLYLKTEGDLQRRAYDWMWRGFGFFLVMYLLVTIMTLVLIPHATRNFQHQPWAWGLVVLNILAIANIPRAISQRRAGYAFISSSATIAALVCLFGIALYPNLITSRPVAENSLTIYNASSSSKTLAIMTIIAFVGMPFVITYTAIVYRTFHGKVRLEEHSY